MYRKLKIAKAQTPVTAAQRGERTIGFFDMATLHLVNSPPSLRNEC